MAPVPLGQVRNIVLAVADMDAGKRFYGEILGFTLSFEDGDRWCVYESGAFTIALARGEQPGVETMGVSMKVADVPAAVERAVGGGASLVSEAITGSHEVRACVRDPDGHPIYFYSSL